MSKYVIKNCPARVLFTDGYFCRQTDGNILCSDCTDCVMKQVVEKLREADDSCYGIDCTECSGFYMCHSKLANDLLKLLDIQEVE